MKILFVDLEYDYGETSRGPNTIGQLGFRTSFERLGHKVIPFYYDSYLKGDLSRLQLDLKALAEEIKPDLIFFILFRDQFKIETLDYLKSKFQTMNWFGDDTWRFDGFTSKYAPHFTYCVTTDKFSLPKYRAIGVSKVIQAQWAAIDHDHFISPKPYKYDVSFVGGLNQYRKWFVNYLEKNGVKVQCFGHGWPNGSLTNEQMIETFASSKINLNLSNSASFDLRYLLKNPKNIAHSLRSKKHASQIKARNFEINYFAGFQLADYVPGIEDYYMIGKEIACYSNPDEALLLINHYLANNEEREHIRDEGMKKARQGFTYKSQLEHVLREFEKYRTEA